MILCCVYDYAGNVIETFVEAVPLENIFMLHPYVFPPSRRSRCTTRLRNTSPSESAKRVTEKKVTEIVDELLKAGRAARTGVEPVHQP